MLKLAFGTRELFFMVGYFVDKQRHVMQKYEV